MVLFYVYSENIAKILKYLFGQIFVVIKVLGFLSKIYFRLFFVVELIELIEG